MPRKDWEATLFLLKIIFFVKSACAMWKMHVVKNYDNGILEGLVVANSPNPKPILS